MSSHTGINAEAELVAEDVQITEPASNDVTEPVEKIVPEFIQETISETVEQAVEEMLNLKLLCLVCPQPPLRSKPRYRSLAKHILESYFPRIF